MAGIEVSFVEDLKKQWMAMIDAVTDPLAIIDEDYTILRQNRSYSEQSQLGNLAITDFQGRKCFEVFAGRVSPCPRCRLPESIAEQKDTEWQSLEEIQPEKTQIVRIHPLDSSLGAKSRYVVHYRDVTEFVKLQDNLSHADKLAALGKLAGGVAHEINSPLAGILAFTQMVLKEIDPEDPHREDLVEIQDAARKCKVIVENLLGFARQDKPADDQEFNLLDCLESTLRLARAMLRKANVAVEFDRPASDIDFLICGKSGKMGQVFLNLITNSIQAIEASGERGGVLLINAYSKHSSVFLEFEDNGPGIPLEVVKKIFDPFFTTKPVGNGTGLGLSISYSIVKQHGGRISVQSSLGTGTKFTIELPAFAAGRGVQND